MPSMKYTKKLLALLLVLVMALGLGITAMADPSDVPHVIPPTQPTPKVTTGDSFTLSVDMYIPDGWTVEYQWQEYTSAGYTDIPGAAERTLLLASYQS